METERSFEEGNWNLGSNRGYRAGFCLWFSNRYLNPAVYILYVSTTILIQAMHLSASQYPPNRCHDIVWQLAALWLTDALLPVSACTQINSPFWTNPRAVQGSMRTAAVVETNDNALWVYAVRIERSKTRRTPVLSKPLIKHFGSVPFESTVRKHTYYLSR